MGPILSSIMVFKVHGDMSADILRSYTQVHYLSYHSIAMSYLFNTVPENCTELVQVEIPEN